MKKTFFGLLILTLIISCLFSMKAVLKWSSKSFWNVVVTLFDNEEKNRQKKSDINEIVRGKDTILIWENMYVIGHYFDSNYLTIERNGISDTILEKVKNYKVKKKKLYVLSEEGYAIIDKENTCRVFITVSKDDFVNGFSTDLDETQHPISRFINDEHIQYLNSYSDFATDEKEIFKKLE